MKKAKKASKGLRKAKKLEAQRPLKVPVSDISVSKQADSASTKLF